MQATLMLASIRVGLSLLPFATLRGSAHTARAVGKRGERQPADSSTAMERAVWAVETAGRHFPWIGKCLYQALAAHVTIGSTRVQVESAYRGETGR